MDKNLLICTDNKGQPILNEVIYYCTKTGALITDISPSHEAIEIEKARQSINNQEIEEKISEVTSEDKFTHEMTMKLLEIVQTKFHLLNDKMHSKKKIWSDIAIEMQSNGYLINCKGTKSADKCHQRWRNLEKIYHGYCRYMKSTGTGKKKPPKYFEEMHELIGEKHSSQPINLLDSLDNFNAATVSDTTSKTRNNEDTNNNNNCETRNNGNTNNEELLLNMSNDNENTKENKDYDLKLSSIFENVKKSVRPKKDNLNMILKELHEHDIQIEHERFEKFQALLIEQNELKRKTLEQRDEFLNVLKSFVNVEVYKKSKKRKHYSSDSSSD